MVSGKYSALSGALSRQQAISTISNNLANVNTTGFKKNTLSFESILNNQQQNSAEGINYSRVGKSSTDFKQGTFKPTENPMDLAIQGKAFFKVQGVNGALYTRRGDFGLRGDNVLTTRHGLPILSEAGGEITIPDAETSKIAFGEDGTIYILGKQGRREEVGKIGLFEIDDPSLLKNAGDTSFSLEQGGQETISQESSLLQGNLEVANVNMVAAMAQLIDNQRAFETLNKAIKSYSTISDQQDKLGSLG
ncbi:flagellar basal-body rod protein FlgF [Desulfotalea psychrophila]|uniref:Related to flagellar basal-body rod protein (FlgF) n=1 Tax=Desulfotalea psychrophila (strain LSv54 / DSM 12343) TaxID=177439 RepID=Q6AJS1_DESPS|nr:flagellar basal-body rod protein FlgF [Desulfotalea psychrophila]CAG37409.1 related to flagellar basal-body rod protein (FlgF) [Desulfotalea psychrophila LSv54]